MLRIDPASNRINPLEVKHFSDLGFSECKHLQGWLQNSMPTLAQRDGLRPVVIRSNIQHT